MKNTLFIACILFVSNQCLAQTPSVNEEAAIKQVVIAETDAYVKRDFKAWVASYVDAPTTSFTVTPNGMPGGISTSSGFQKMSKGMKAWMDASPQSEMQVISRDGWLSHVNGNMAWISYDQVNLMVKTGAKITSKELKVLDKVDGQWKISATNSIWDFNHTEYGTPNPEEEDIKAVIINETEMFLDQKKDAWAENFLHEPYITWSVTNGGEPGDVLTMRGWDALNTYMNVWFGNDMSALVKEWRKAKTTRDQWQIQIRSNMAYVSYNQHVANDEKKTKMDSTETRVLEKINGKWKITMLTALADFKDATPPIKSKY